MQYSISAVWYVISTHLPLAWALHVNLYSMPDKRNPFLACFHESSSCDENVLPMDAHTSVSERSMRRSRVTRCPMNRQARLTNFCCSLTYTSSLVELFVYTFIFIDSLNGRHVRILCQTNVGYWRCEWIMMHFWGVAYTCSKRHQASNIHWFTAPRGQINWTMESLWRLYPIMDAAH